MADESFQERTEKATSRRREKAREEGQVAKSMELNSAAVICLGFVTLYLMGPYIAGQALALMRATMANAPSLALADPTFTGVFRNHLLKFFIILGPVFAVLTVIAVGVNVAQVGFRITPKASAPQLDKLDPVKGFKRIFSVRSAVTLLRDLLKLTVVAFVAYRVIAAEFPEFYRFADMTVAQIAAAMGKLALELALKVGAVILVIAVLDYIYQRYEFEKSIRMSKQDLKDEFKDTEGSPQIKARVRQIQLQIARSRMMEAVPTADVVITNPTHYAVALKYAPEEHRAPHVVAKGQRLVAQKIKEIALAHNVPCVEDRPLAQALFKMCDVGQMIPAALFRAVAEVLAYVYRLKGQGVH
ncbi:MAG TPA: flagellar biosynthesis protein FlhB [candidate division Zixibacteria bacterium]|nr:flagellar biosynthesis protein FlhB [candidate division Zixibacteria bacterium]